MFNTITRYLIVLGFYRTGAVVSTISGHASMAEAEKALDAYLADHPGRGSIWIQEREYPAPAGVE